MILSVSKKLILKAIMQAIELSNVNYLLNLKKLIYLEFISISKYPFLSQQLISKEWKSS